jgi:nicotinamidase-related amidase
MTKGGKNSLMECVVIDLNTQRDFLDANGAYPVLNQAELIPSLRRVIAWTKRNHCPVVSAIDAHRHLELRTESEPVHCLDGTRGQLKLGFTLFPLHDRIEYDNTLAVPLDLFDHFQQIIFRKRNPDLLSNPKADQFLTELDVREFVVFGSGLETSVKILALGLLARNRKVTVVHDACGYWDKTRADLACRQLEAKGARLLGVDDLLRRKLSRKHRYPLHPIAPIQGCADGFSHLTRVNGATNGANRASAARRSGRALPRLNGKGKLSVFKPSPRNGKGRH